MVQWGNDLGETTERGKCAHTHGIGVGRIFATEGVLIGVMMWYHFKV